MASTAQQKPSCDRNHVLPHRHHENWKVFEIMSTVKLVRDGEEHKYPVEIKITQVTPQAVCNLFSVRCV